MKKSFLTWAILALFFVHSFSFLTYAQSSSWDFNLEWISFSATWWWGWWWWMTTEQLAELINALKWWWTWWTWWWNWWWDWNLFNYSEREQNNSDNIWWDSSEFQTQLSKQITALSAWSYTNIKAIDLDNDWFEEILVTDWSLMKIYEWNWTTFRQSRFYWIESLPSSYTSFLRLEDENWESVYYLIDYHTWTINKEWTLSFWWRIEWTWFAQYSAQTALTSTVKNRIITWWNIDLYWEPRSCWHTDWKWVCHNPCMISQSNVSWTCNYVTVDTNWLHLNQFSMSETTANFKMNWKNYRCDNCRHDRNGSWWERFSMFRWARKNATNMFTWSWACERFYSDDPSWVSLTLDSRFQTSRWSNYFKLYYKWWNFWANKSDSLWWAYRCNNTNRNFSLMQFLYWWNANWDYWYTWWKFFFKNKENQIDIYNYYWSTQKIWWYTVYRYVKEENSSSNTWPKFDTATTSSEKAPYVEWNTIVDSEYDTFVTKTNSDWTYNYKITLENPEWEQVIAFYWLNYNWIIFKDVNWDWVKDIMTYENYVSEDNIKFKRIYEFIFNPETYTYDKVLDWIDTLEYKWYDVDDDWDLDLFVKRYDEKLYMYKNNNLESYFTNLWSIRWKYYLIRDNLVSNWKHWIITKNMNNNWLTWEWKLYDIDWNWYNNITQNYSNWLIWSDYKNFQITSWINLIWIKKETDKWKVVYYNDVTWLIENFPIEFYVTDLTWTYTLYSSIAWLQFLNFITKDWTELYFYKNTETWKYIRTEIRIHNNWVTLIAWNTTTWSTEYSLNWEKFYVAANKADIISHLWEYAADHIITTKVTDFGWLFQNNTTFNENISNWDTSNVTNMSNMFNWATSFNNWNWANLNNWDTTKVTTLQNTFNWATSFNKSINSWNTSNVTNMSWLFQWATSYNQTISSWDVSKVTTISNMFNWATSFNQNISSKVFFQWILTHTWTWYDTWTTSWSSANKPQLRTILTKPNWITKYATNISMPDWTYVVNWTTYYVVSNKAWIEAKIKANRANANSIITTKVTDMSWLFYTENIWRYTSSRPRWCTLWSADDSWKYNFNASIASWDTSNVTTMENMFKWATAFNQDISKWDTSNVTNMNNIFCARTKVRDSRGSCVPNSWFRWNISSWNVKKVWANHTWLRCNWCTWPTWSA